MTYPKSSCSKFKVSARLKSVSRFGITMIASFGYFDRFIREHLKYRVKKCQGIPIPGKGEMLISPNSGYATSHTDAEEPSRSTDIFEMINQNMQPFRVHGSSTGLNQFSSHYANGLLACATHSHKHDRYQQIASKRY